VADDKGTGWEATRSAWDEVGERFADLGRRLAEQYRKLGDERGTEAQEEARRSVKEAVQVALGQVDKAFTSVGNAMRDPDSKQDLQRAARTLADAVSATFSELSSEIREQLGSRPPSGPGAPTDPGSPSA
jgi:DNA-binding ferritin-like protein